MSQSKSSRRWLDEHHNDAYVRKSKAMGLRSRAAFKLEELLDRDLNIHPDMVIVDLGAAPGGWSQVVAPLLKGRGKLLALDILPMEPIAGVEFIQGDFSSDAVYQQLLTQLGELRVDLVLSDIAPNMTGIKDVDSARSYALAELGLEFAEQHLKPGGAFAVKIFQGDGFDSFLKRLRVGFSKVLIRKPDASRSRSRELYALALDRRRA